MKCQNCNKPITALRKSKKYCDTACRVDHHNKIQRYQKRKWEIYQNQLDQNYQILFKLYQQKSNWSLSDLKAHGYQSNFFTHINPNYKDWHIYNLYEFNIWIHPNQWVIIAYSDLTNLNHKPYPKTVFQKSMEYLLS